MSANTIRTVKTEDSSIRYQLNRKDVKNINLRIRVDGSVSVSAKSGIPTDKIDDFVLSKSKYILSALAKFESRENLLEQPKQYVSGESFMILGRSVRLKVIEDDKESVESDCVYIYLTVKDKSDYINKNRLIERYLKTICKNVFMEIVNEIYPMFKKYNVKMPVLRIKDMKTRWGSCSPSKGIITLNSKLLSAPRNSIEYVVLHEFCHFIHPNHSKEFYNFVTMLMPDWKERKRYLDEGLCV